MRLIDADAVVARLDKDLYSYEAALVKDYLDLFPTIEAEPVKHARWEMDAKNHCHCTECDFGRDIRTQIGWKHCPNCGAAMDLEE